ncbi:MAG TPA: hypothetical protein VFB85_01330 [Vicinamibacterales bacterium]|jgi:hypothetical protein|nr:hypothetical protein [Vicinamibacterales bacterium]
MHVALGLKAHSGWAALVAIGQHDGTLSLVDRRRLELVDRDEASWAKQPYHAAEGLPARDARQIVERGLTAARRHATREVRDAVTRLEREGHTIDGCAVLMGQPMPEWSVDDILAVHFRMHKAEGVLFRDALARAAKACGQRLVEIPEKTLQDHARRALGAPPVAFAKHIATLGKTAGPPWGKDQKEAALAAMIALGRL